MKSNNVFAHRDDAESTVLFLSESESTDTKSAQQYSSLNNDVWLTTAEAATYLGITDRTLFNLTSRGEVPYYKLGRRNRFLRSELRNLLMQQRRGGSYGV